jgi:hypothetical protein
MLRTCEYNAEQPRVPFDFTRVPIAAPRIQCAPTVSSPGDAFEQEADDVADRVMRTIDPTPVNSPAEASQRECTDCDDEEAEESVQHAPLVARQSIEGGDDEESEVEEGGGDLDIQLKAESGPPMAASSPVVVDRLAGKQSDGEPLASGTRAPVELAFGRDFSGVRVHHDSEAAELTRNVSALAFTHGSHIYFGSGKYDPNGSSGRRLLAHELTHVIQQGQAAPRGGKATHSPALAPQTDPPAIQRVANWAAAAVHETNSLANTAVVGADAGVTAPTFNGGVALALNAPTVNVSPVAAGGFDATVTAVAANIGSADETVLSPGPWRRVEPRANIGGLFPSLVQCVGAGNSNFRARGNPSDAAMSAANRRHEDHHAADGRAAFNGSVVPWDARLTAANAAGTTFHGATAAAATAALFAAVGGTPAQIRGAFVTAWNAAIPLFHATPAGGPIGAPTDPTAAADCSWSFARFTNPS